MKTYTTNILCTFYLYTIFEVIVVLKITINLELRLPFIAKKTIGGCHYYSLVKSVKFDGKPRHEILEDLVAYEDAVLQITTNKAFTLSRASPINEVI
jgi:hypothetical protein